MRAPHVAFAVGFVLAAVVGAAAPDYAGMPQTRGRGSGGASLSGGGDVGGCTMGSASIACDFARFGNVDAGVVRANMVDAGYIAMGCGNFVNLCPTDARAYMFRTTANQVDFAGAVRTGNGSGVGDITCRGDFYLGPAAELSIAVGTRNFTSDGHIKTTNTRTNGTITLAAGTGTATTFTGAGCTCTDQTAANAVQCSVSGTTLTANGTGTDVIRYHCL